MSAHGLWWDALSMAIIAEMEKVYVKARTDWGIRENVNWERSWRQDLKLQWSTGRKTNFRMWCLRSASMSSVVIRHSSTWGILSFCNINIRFPSKMLKFDSKDFIPGPEEIMQSMKLIETTKWNGKKIKIIEFMPYINALRDNGQNQTLHDW